MTQADAVARIVASTATVSDKIRALDGMGFPRAEIARLLGKRYQHVRNVLEGDRVGRGAQPTGVAEEPAVFERDDERPAGWRSSSPPRPEFEDRGQGIFRLSLRPDGSVLLPPSVLEALGLKSGGFIARLEGDTLVVDGAKETLRKIRELIPPRQPGEPLWSDELIAERRREAAWEELSFEEARAKRAAFETARAKRAAEDG